MDLDQEFQAFQQKYTKLEQQAAPGSVERHVYAQVTVFINSAQNVIPTNQRPFNTQIRLVSLAKTLDPPSKRYMVWEAVEELEQIADLPPVR